MKNLVFIVLSISALSAAAYTFFNISGKTGLGIVFICGFLFGIFLMNIRLNMKNDKINSYKRELEKESIASDENSSRVLSKMKTILDVIQEKGQLLQGSCNGHQKCGKCKIKVLNEN